jgi:hypothetical protein
MQIQQVNPGLAQLLVKLLPLVSQTAGNAAGGPIGGALGGLTGAGLESVLSQQNPEAQSLSGQSGMQQIGDEIGNGAMQNIIRNLLQQLSSSQTEAQQSIVPEALAESEDDQRRIFENILSKMSGDGRNLMLKYLKGIAANTLNQGAR